MGVYKYLDFALVFSVLPFISVPASATEMIAYSYDAKARLVKMVRTGTVNNNVTTEYEHDKADNRKKVEAIIRPTPLRREWQQGLRADVNLA